MKKIVCYSNCQGRGLFTFAAKTKLAERYTFHLHENYRIILNETSTEQLMEDARTADIFVFQPMSAQKHGMLSTEEMIESVVPQSALKLSWAYQFNHGFFPIAKYGGWWTGRAVLEDAACGSSNLVHLFDNDMLHFDCARRFAECLGEQSRREEACDIRLAPWILQNFQTKHLFTILNHPASELFVELVRRLLRILDLDYRCEIPIENSNQTLLPGYHAVHPAVVRELGLKYPIPQNDGADAAFYRVLMAELQATKGVL